MTKPVLFVVAVALVDQENRVLLAQRPTGKDMAGLWEFPGGKVHNGETPEEALCREIREELALDIVPADLTPLTFASHEYERFHLFMPLYLCRNWCGTLTPQEGQAVVWVTENDLEGYAMPPADRPLIAPLLRMMSVYTDGLSHKAH
jgi:8-oxo-dGTP diphosphatase